MDRYLTLNPHGQVALSGHSRYRPPCCAPLYPVRFPSSISSCLPQPILPSTTRTLAPLPPPITFVGRPSVTCSSRLSIDVQAFSRSSQLSQQNDRSNYSASTPSDRHRLPGSWVGSDSNPSQKENRGGHSEDSRAPEDDPLESFLTYLNDAFPDGGSDFEQRPTGCRLSIKDEPLTAAPSSDANNSNNKRKLEWDDDYVTFNESLALKDLDLLNSTTTQAEDQNKQESEEFKVERTVPRKLKQGWIKSSQLEAEREAQSSSSGRSLRWEWPSPVGHSRTGYSLGSYFILAPFCIDVNQRLTISEAHKSAKDSLAISEAQNSLKNRLAVSEEQNSLKDRLANSEIQTSSQDTLPFTEEESCIKNNRLVKTEHSLSESQSSGLTEDDSDSCSKKDNCLSKNEVIKVSAREPTRKRRKQVKPHKSPSLVDPLFKGVLFSIKTLIQKESSKLVIHHAYSNVPHKPLKCRPRKRRRDTYSSSDSYSDLDDTFTCQEAWISCPGKQCTSCGAKKTPLWRDAEDGTPLCNACGIRYRKYRLRCPACWYIPRKDGKSHARCGCCGASLR